MFIWVSKTMRTWVNEIWVARTVDYVHLCWEGDEFSPGFVAIGHLSSLKFLRFTERLFAAEGCHSLLWPKATTFENSQNRGSLASIK